MREFRAAIASRLREARVFSGMTVVELATTIGIASIRITHYESGRNVPRLDDAIRWVVACDLDPSWLFVAFDGIKDRIAADLAEEAERHAGTGCHQARYGRSPRAVRAKVPGDHDPDAGEIQRIVGSG